MSQKTGISKLKKAKITAAKERAAAMFKVGYNPQQYTYHSPEVSDSEDEYQVSLLQKSRSLAGDLAISLIFKKFPNSLNKNIFNFFCTHVYMSLFLLDMVFDYMQGLHRFIFVHHNLLNTQYRS